MHAYVPMPCPHGVVNVSTGMFAIIIVPKPVCTTGEFKYPLKSYTAIAIINDENSMLVQLADV